MTVSTAALIGVSNKSINLALCIAQRVTLSVGPRFVQMIDAQTKQWQKTLL